MQREVSISTEEADQILRNLEENSSLFDFRLDNWYIWPILRYPVAMRLMNLPWTQISNDEKLNALERIRIGISDIVKLKVQKTNYVILSSSSGLVDKFQNQYLDIYFDELLPHLSPCFKFEHINNKEYLRNQAEVLYPPQLTTNTPYIFAGILAKLSPSRRINGISLNISSILENELHLQISPQYLANLIKTFFWRKKVYNFLFSKLQPRSLLLINAYNNHAIVAAAKEKKIKVIEFQHGLISAHHPGYSWDKSRLPFKQNMPIPDRIFLYGDFWKNELLTGGFWGDSLVSTGSLRMDRYRKLRVGRIQSDTCNLLVTMQGLDITNLCLFLVDFLKLLQGKLKLSLSIKLHPREHNTHIYQQVFAGLDNVTIIPGSSMPSTFDLLVDSDLHASISSTCHYEALALGIPTLILPFSSHEKVLHLTDTGFAIKIQSPIQMAEFVLDNRYATVPISIGDQFFRSDALSNILVSLSND